MDNDKLINDLLRMSEMNSMSLWKRDVCKRAADALSVPAVYAVEVVRCGECVHRYVAGDNVRFNVCELNHNKVQSDEWFCADGERRADATD